MKSVCPPMWCGRPAGCPCGRPACPDNDVFVCGGCSTPADCGAEGACHRELDSAMERARVRARQEIVERNRERNVTVERIGDEWVPWHV